MLDSIGVQSYELTKLIKCLSNMTTLVIITESTTSLDRPYYSSSTSFCEIFALFILPDC